jgi:ketosteroid isomerase-like protein
MSGVPSSATDPIADRHQLHFAASKSGDGEALSLLFCEDAVLMAPNETTLYGRPEVREWWDEYFENFQITALGVTERDVTVLDGWVIERFAYTIAITPVAGGERIRDDSRWFAVWRRDADGVWRVAQAMFNSIRPIGSGTSRFISRMSQRRNKAEG